MCLNATTTMIILIEHEITETHEECVRKVKHAIKEI